MLITLILQICRWTFSYARTAAVEAMDFETSSTKHFSKIHGLCTYTCCVRFYPNSLAAVAVCSYGCGLPSLWNSQYMFVYVTFINICGLFPQVGILRFQNPVGFSLNSLLSSLYPQAVTKCCSFVEGKKVTF